MKYLLIFLAFVIFFISCDKNLTGITNSTEVMLVENNPLTIGGYIDSNITITKNNMPVLFESSIEIADGNFIKIEPGVTILINDNVNVGGEGNLIAIGNITNLINFTSNGLSGFGTISVGTGDTLEYTEISDGGNNAPFYYSVNVYDKGVFNHNKINGGNKYGISLGSLVSVSYLTVENFDYGIFLVAGRTNNFNISNSIFNDNSKGAIFVMDGYNTNIHLTIFESNIYGGATIYTMSKTEINLNYTYSPDIDITQYIFLNNPLAEPTMNAGCGW